MQHQNVRKGGSPNLGLDQESTKNSSLGREQIPRNRESNWDDLAGKSGIRNNLQSSGVCGDWAGWPNVNYLIVDLGAKGNSWRQPG
jgi:hypothetical protein